MVQSLQMELEGSGVRASVVRPGPTWSEMGSDWDPDEAAFVLTQWVRFGMARHPHFMKAGAVGDAITTVVSAPRGVHLSLVEVNPEAPVGGAMTTTAAGLDAIPEVSVAVPDEDGHGHLAEMRIDPVALFERVHAECGEIGRFRIAGKEVIMVTGAEVNEQFFKAPDSTLDQAAAYPFMTPIFGKGVVFDASPEERQQMLKNQALRGDQMRGHATTIENEIKRMVAEWGDEGEVDLLDFFAELTIYNTAACLVGTAVPRGDRPPVRRGLPRPRARHRRAGLRRPLHGGRRVLRDPRPLAGDPGRAGAGHHRPPQGAWHGGARRARPARRAHLAST